MTQLKRFIKWCIDNELAFTNIEEARRAFYDKEDLEDGMATQQKLTTAGTSSFKTRHEIRIRTVE